MYNEIKEFINTVKILETWNVWNYIVLSIRIFISTMGMVYLWGRMLEFTNTNRSRNAVAALTCFISSTLLIILKDNSMFQYIWNIYTMGCVGIIIYVLFGFRLFARLAKLQSKKIGEEGDDDFGIKKHKKGK